MCNSNFGKFEPLIGVIYVGSTCCKFMVYSTKNAEVLAVDEAKLKEISHTPGWMEYDPAEIWKNVQDCIANVYRSLTILEINPQDIVAIGICTKRGTTLMWDKETGIPLYNAIGWDDSRSVSTLKTVLHLVKGNVDYLRYRSGLPLSTCFSALKIKWLLETVPAVEDAIKDGNCLFGSLDSWILWNLTGATECGVHAMDVTNAAYTLLMNINTMQWDEKLCNFFKIPTKILPSIRSNSEIYGVVIGGPLSSLPIACCIGEQPATLLGQLSINIGRNICTIDDSCFLMLHTGNELVRSENGLVTTIGYKLGPKEMPCYALEGAISNAGSTITWLKENLRINTEVNQNGNVVDALTSFLGETSMISSSCSSTMLNFECGLAAKRSELIFVPAFHGLYSPYWRYDARGVLLGLTSQTTAENVTQAAFEATGFQIHEIFEAYKRDTPTWANRTTVNERLIVSGDFAENNTFLQYVADIVGCLVERPQTISAPCLGAMIAAGVTMKVVSLSSAVDMYMPPADAFLPATLPNRREILYKRWSYAVKKCLNWNNYQTYDTDIELFTQRELDPSLPIRRSIPGSFFLTTTFVLLLWARFLHGRNTT